MMISSTGNRAASGRGGFSFIEVMVTLAVLSLGIVLIYRAFFVSLDVTHHLACRLAANGLINERVSLMERALVTEHKILFPKGEDVHRLKVGEKDVLFRFASSIAALEGVPQLFAVNLSLSWQESGRNVSVNRAFYLGP